MTNQQAMKYQKKNKNIQKSYKKKQKQKQKKRERQIGTNINLGKTVSPFGSFGNVPSIDKTASDFDKARKKVKKLKKLVDPRLFHPGSDYTFY